MAYDFEVIARCDALVRLPGESEGADRGCDTPASWGAGVPVRPAVRHAGPLSRQVATPPLDPRGERGMTGSRSSWSSSVPTC